VPCVKARGAATAAHRRLFALRAAAKKAHGAHRHDLSSRAALAAQQVVVADATTKSSCARRPVEGYPFT
jgi:hypothetical protein